MKRFFGRMKFEIRRAWRIRQFPVGTIIEDCNFHPCMVTDNDWHMSVDTISLLTGREGSCSVMHCGVVKLNRLQLWQAFLAYKKDGEFGLAARHGWTKEKFDDFQKEWRSDSK